MVSPLNLSPCCTDVVSVCPKYLSCKDILLGVVSPINFDELSNLVGSVSPINFDELSNLVGSVSPINFDELSNLVGVTPCFGVVVVDLGADGELSTN